jgi:L-lactate dehydrogenase
MVTARVVEAALRDERAVFPIGRYQPHFGVTLSLPSVVGREGVVSVIEPDLTGEERIGLERSAEALKAARRKIAQVGT